MKAQLRGASLVDYLRILRRHWLLIAVIVLGCLAAGALQLGRQTPRYRAVSQILLDQAITATPGGYVDIYGADRQLENDLAFANSPLVGDQLTKDLGYRPQVRAASVTADVVAFTSESEDPAAAASEANLFAETFILARRQRLSNTFTAAIAEREAAIAALQTERAAVDPLSAGGPGRVIELGDRIAALITQRDELRVSARFETAAGATVIAPATAPKKPFAPDRLRTMGLALVIGLVIAGAAARLRDYFDDTIRTREDLDRAAEGLTYLGALPQDRARAAENPAEVAENGRLDEAFRSLRTSVQFAGLRQPLRSIQVTSANSAEGKTTTASYLAVALAQAGENVVLIDGDLRKPTVHQRFGLSKEPGLCDLLIGNASTAQAYHRVRAGADMWVLPSGPTPGNPSNFLSAAASAAGGPNLRDYIASLVEAGFMVVLDSPPILPVADALTLSHMVEGTLLVAAANQTGARSLERAIEQLNQANARIVGTVLNGLADSRSAYGYGYGYGAPTSKPSRRKRVRRREAARDALASGTPLRQPALPPTSNGLHQPASSEATSAGSNGRNGVANGAASGRRTPQPPSVEPAESPDAALSRELQALLARRVDPSPEHGDLPSGGDVRR